MKAGQEAALESPISGRRWRRVGGEEAALLREAKKGSPQAIETLVRRHWDDAHRTAFLIVQDSAAAEDIAQEAVLAAVRSIDRFDRRRPFRPWLHRIAANRALDWLRARQRRWALTVEHSGEAAAVAAPAADGGGLTDEVTAALSTLDPKDRAIVVLRHLFGYEPKEIAAMVEMPAATVRTRLHRALARLRERLEDGEEAGR